MSAQPSASPAPALDATREDAIAVAPSDACDFSSAAFVRLLVGEFARLNDVSVRDGIVKALALPGTTEYPDVEVAENPDLATAAIVDLYTNLLDFSAGQSFTELQIQQLLLLLTDVTDLIANVDPLAATADQHPLSSVLFHFTRKLSRMCSAVPMLVDERSVVTVTREEEQVDPAAQAAFEARLAKAKKGQEKAVEPPAKIKVQITEEREIFTRKTVQVGPYFTPADALTIVEYFDGSVFQHWHLVRFAITQPRDIVTMEQHVFLDDVPTFLPPLSAALPLDDYTLLEQRVALEEAWAAEAAATRSAEHAERQALLADASRSEAEVAARDRAAWEADHAAALTEAEYSKTVAVLSTAVAAATNKKVTNAGLLKRLERLEVAATAFQGGTPAAAPSVAAAAAPSPTAAAKKK